MRFDLSFEMPTNTTEHSIESLIQLTNNEIIKINEQLLIKQRNSTISKSIYRNYVEVDQEDLNRQDLLDQFLSEKQQQYANEINMIIIPEFRSFLQEKFKIINRNYDLNGDEFIEMGSTSCHLEQIAFSSPKKTAPVCPWHWVLIEREDLYPFVRANAKCNCNNCLAKTVYDTKNVNLSQCRQTFMLLPSLVRRSVSGSLEKWWFTFEEVPSSCYCAIKLNIFL